jgi:hypothetical protein
MTKDSGNDPQSLSRRSVLRAAGLGAGVAGAAAVGLAGREAKAAAPGRADRRVAGYRETDHVKAYYDALARF